MQRRWINNFCCCCSSAVYGRYCGNEMSNGQQPKWGDEWMKVKGCARYEESLALATNPKRANEIGGYSDHNFFFHWFFFSIFFLFLYIFFFCYNSIRAEIWFPSKYLLGGLTWVTHARLLANELASSLYAASMAHYPAAHNERFPSVQGPPPISRANPTLTPISTEFGSPVQHNGLCFMFINLLPHKYNEALHASHNLVGRKVLRKVLRAF